MECKALIQLTDLEPQYSKLKRIPLSWPLPTTADEKRTQQIVNVGDVLWDIFVRDQCKLCLLGIMSLCSGRGTLTGRNEDSPNAFIDMQATIQAADGACTNPKSDNKLDRLIEYVEQNSGCGARIKLSYETKRDKI